MCIRDSVNTGLIMEFEDPSMLRGVLAHETGHIAGAHLARSDIALKKAQAPMIVGLLLGIGAAVAGGDSDAVQGILLGSQEIGQGMVAKYSRGQEAAADQAAFQYLEKLGLSSKGMIEVLYNFADQEALSSKNQSSRVRSHPISRQRIRALENQAINSSFYNQNDSEELFISIDSKIASDFRIKINDQITLNILGREIVGTVKNFRKVDYRDLSINFAIIINNSFVDKLPYEYIGTLSSNLSINEIPIKVKIKFTNPIPTELNKAVLSPNPDSSNILGA